MEEQFNKQAYNHHSARNSSQRSPTHSLTVQEHAADAIVTACHDDTYLQGQEDAVVAGARRIMTRHACQPRKTLWGDNKSANLIAVNPVSGDRSKQIRVRHLRAREAVELDEITVDWIGTKFMVADGLTKVLPRPALSDVSDKLHLVDVGQPPRDACGGVS